MRSLRRIKIGIGFLFLLCLHSYDGKEQVMDVDSELLEKEQAMDVDSELLENFMFDCSKQTWISPCNEAFNRKYLMLFNNNGDYLKETLNKKNETKSFLSASPRKKARGQDIRDGKGYPTFLFQLESNDASPGTFYIVTSSGKLLVAGDENLNPSLLLEEDHCTSSTTTTTTATTTTTLVTTTTIPLTTTTTTMVTTTTIPITTTTTTMVTTTIITAIPPTTTTTTATTTPITSMAPNVGYDCNNQALWTLWKVDERFLVIESVHKEGFYLFVGRNRHVTLNEGSYTMMTGIKTSFLSTRESGGSNKYITLERSAGKPEPGIGPEAYGDVVVHYFDRDGSQKSGYVCDYEWELEDATAVCRHLGYKTGMPTYNGRYSNTRTPEYAITGLSCDDDFGETCKFRTICGKNNPSCIVQLSMKLNEGKGHSCNRGSATDVAGVICGSLQQITTILKKEITCDKGTIQQDTNSVARMFSIQQQIDKVGSKMFENKHWSEYLLPMPQAIALMSTLLLVSSQFDRDVELLRPISGEWEYIKFDYLQPNLLLLSQNVEDNFKLANRNMGVIKVNCDSIQGNLQKSVAYAFSSNKVVNTVLLNKTLGYINEDAQTNMEKAVEVAGAFEETSKIIGEILQALQNTKSDQGNIKANLVFTLGGLKNTTETDKEKLKEEKEKKLKDDAKVKKSRKAYDNAVNSALKAQCVNGYTECNNCAFQKSVITNDCKPGKMKEYCDQEKVCSKNHEYCYKRFVTCQEYRYKCIKWKFVEKNCRNKCLEFKYYPEVSGNYCQDVGYEGQLCSKCNWIDAVFKTSQNVAAIQMRIQMDVLQNEGSYSRVTQIATDVVIRMVKLNQDVKNNTTSSPPPTTTNTPASTSLPPPTTTNTPVSSNLPPPTTTTNTPASTSPPPPTTTSSPTTNKFIKPQLTIMKPLFEMYIDELKPNQVQIASTLKNYLLNLKIFTNDLIGKEIKFVHQMTDIEKSKVTTFLTMGKALQKEAEELQEKNEISIGAPPVSAADPRTGTHAYSLIDNLTTRHKRKKEIESLTNKLSNVLKKILEKEIKTKDLQATIQYLEDCLQHLRYLKTQWSLLTTFFQKIADSVKNINKNINRLGLTDLAQYPELYKITKESTQREIVDILADNIYVRQIAYFYTKIFEDECLEKMNQIGSNLKKFSNPQTLANYKKFILAEAEFTQDRIKKYVSKQEAKQSEKITKEISSIKNVFACKLEDKETSSDSDFKRHGDLASRENDKENDMGNASDTEEEENPNKFTPMPYVQDNVPDTGFTPDDYV